MANKIQSNNASAQDISNNILRINELLSKSSVTYAAETNISAKENAISIYELAESTIFAHQQVLSDDAGYIGTLGNDFEALDTQLSKITSGVTE